ncbi:MAG: hypothetical protein EOQ78_30310, partial [Mesorhizobium sp.]
SQATGMAVDAKAVLTGTAAPLIAASGHGFDTGPAVATADIATYARLAAAKGPGAKPKPLYLRGADAKPQAGFILPRRSHESGKPGSGEDHAPKGKKS